MRNSAAEMDFPVGPCRSTKNTNEEAPRKIQLLSDDKKMTPAATDSILTMA